MGFTQPVNVDAAHGQQYLSARRVPASHAAATLPVDGSVASECAPARHAGRPKDPGIELGRLHQAHHHCRALPGQLAAYEQPV